MKYISNPIDDYFLNKGIQVRYNCLGDQDLLIHTYIKESFPRFDRSKFKESHFIKHDHYKDWYNIQPRMKMTGFEEIKKIDLDFRANNKIGDICDQWDYPSRYYEIFDDDNEKYIENLKTSLSRIENPMLFYSGGVDSELIFSCFLDLGIKFNVVIFELTDSLGQLINKYDIDHATEFCKRNGIIPIVKAINPEEIWVKDEFVSIVQTLKNNSPHIATHAYMIHIMAEEFPGYTYCFAGEIRYMTDPFDVGSKKSVLVKSAKVTPSFGYADVTSYYGGGYSYAQIQLDMYAGSGTYTISWQGNFGTTINGTWTTTPSNPYDTVIGWDGTFQVNIGINTYYFMQTVSTVSGIMLLHRLRSQFNTAPNESQIMTSQTWYIRSGSSGPVVYHTYQLAASWLR
jgi:hypothetical protein